MKESGQAGVSPENQHSKHGDKPLCGAKRHKLDDTCKLPAGWGTKHPGEGRCRKHGGNNTGPDPESMKGNQRGRKHGLFSKYLNPKGQDVYNQALDAEGATLTRDAAAFLVGQIAQAYDQEITDEDIRGPVEAFIWDQVNKQQLSAEKAIGMISRLRQPTPNMLAKALAPLKGLLETQRSESPEEMARVIELRLPEGRKL